MELFKLQMRQFKQIHVLICFEDVQDALPFKHSRPNIEPHKILLQLNCG